MKTFFKKENLKNSILSLVYLVFGLMFCILPIKMFNFVESALCFILLIVGIVGILIYSLMAVEDKDFKMLLYGIVGMALSICMFLLPRLFGIILSVVIGLGGVSMIISAIKLKKAKNSQWISDLIIGIIVSALAIVTIVLSGTNVAKKLIAIFFGVMCLINGIYSLVNLIILAKKESKLSKLNQKETEKPEELVSEAKEEKTEEK